MLGILALDLAVTAITVDQSRVVMITTFPLVVALAAFTSRADDPPEVRSIAAGVRVAGAVVGLLAPLTVSWVGEIFPMGDPFRVHW